MACKGMANPGSERRRYRPQGRGNMKGERPMPFSTAHKPIDR